MAHHRRKTSPRRKPITQGLRNAIRGRRLTAYAAAKQAGVSVDAVQRFLNGQRSLSLGTVDKIASALDLELCEEKDDDQRDND
ncbi:hypothetical protein AYO47_05260 [Planctomyces sp. SCGC AG-212-M04]|nr:hypothetical protein AYO47_05260 [Planctomyces sp. SCGC AG-212-M04]